MLNAGNATAFDLLGLAKFRALAQHPYSPSSETPY
jgi:hypothetical protein